ncbi:MAG: 7-carboxy-7-deazaguanine synthase QueE, partial [Microcystaceae cyanobacterium]
EPLMHDLNPLTGQLGEWGLRVHLETSGAYSFSGSFDWVTFSPKRFKPPHESIYRHVNELKVVVANVNDLEWAIQQAAKVPPETVKYLQPEWNTPQSQDLIFDYVLKHPEWRISLQTHKFLGVR